MQQVVKALAVAVLALAACRGIPVAQGDPAPLIDGFRSFESSATVSGALKQRGLSFTEVERSSRPGPASAPKFERLVWRIAEFEHLGQRGELLLQFHNDRLMETVFYPQNVLAYLQALKMAGYRVPDAMPTSPGTPASVVPPGDVSESTEVLAVTDTQGRRYVMWGDRRIRNEYLAWINAYA